MAGVSPKSSAEARVFETFDFHTFKRILVQAVPCRAAALDLRDRRATVLALRQMQYENVLRLAGELGNVQKGE
jgi:hypothetical protein